MPAGANVSLPSAIVGQVPVTVGMNAASGVV
jgi:hypothetical protein